MILRPAISWCVCLLLAFAACHVLAQTSGGGGSAEWTPATAGRGEYGTTPIWSDEFNGPLDTRIWTAEDAAWPHNGELEYYSPDAKYVRAEDGVLKITATNDANGGRDYTSARISTKNSVLFKQGLYAARIKLTEGQGIWPAWWLFGAGPKYSEIDIAESVGGTAATTKPPTGSGDDTAAGTLIHFAVEEGPRAPVTKGPAKSHKLPGRAKWSSGFHVFWLEWTGTEVWCGFDDADNGQKLVDDISQLDAFQAHMYMILNVAIGGGFPGDPDETTPFPQTMEVDWVRVYTKPGQQNVLLDLNQLPGVGDEGTNDGQNNAGGGVGGGNSDNGVKPVRRNSAGSVGSSFVMWMLAAFAAIAAMRL